MERGYWPVVHQGYSARERGHADRPALNFALLYRWTVRLVPQKRARELLPWLDSNPCSRRRLSPRR